MVSRAQFDERDIPKIPICKIFHMWRLEGYGAICHGHFLLFSFLLFENATKLSLTVSPVSVPDVETMRIPSIEQMS